MLLAKVIIYNKSELDKCVTNLLHEKDINVSFRDRDVFVDRMDEMFSEVLFQTINDISSFTPETKYSSGISIKVNPVHFKHGLDIIDENEPFVIYIYRTVYKIVQVNFSSISPLIEVEELDKLIFRTRQIEDKMNSESLANMSTLEVQMNEIVSIFRKIYYAETHGILYPFYTLEFNEEYSSVAKGDIREHYVAFQLDNFHFSGKPVKVRVSEKFEKAKNMFNPYDFVTIKCYDEAMIHFSQKCSPTMKIDFLLGLMSE